MSVLSGFGAMQLFMPRAADAAEIAELIATQSALLPLMKMT